MPKSIYQKQSFLSQRWWAFVRTRDQGAPALDRRALEVCVFSHIADALQSGDLYVPGSGAYDDYRTQLLPWAQCEAQLGRYGQAVGLPTSGHDLVATLRRRLNELATEVDNGFPDNSELTIDPDGTPHLKRQRSKPLPADLPAFEKAVRSRMPERHLLDILKHVHHWVPYTRHFGPPSGSDPKLKDAARRYLFTIFGFGCNLGASQTARHVPESVNRQTLHRINAQHINADKLEAAVADISTCTSASSCLGSRGRPTSRLPMVPRWNCGRTTCSASGISVMAATAASLTITSRRPTSRCSGLPT